MAQRLRILSYNIHKGFSVGNTRFVLREMKEGIRKVGADLVFLQEVLGEHQRHAETVDGWPDASQFEFLADEVSQGHVVKLPVFGQFAAVLMERKCDLARDPTPRCKPEFSPSVGFIQQVRTCAPATPAAKRRLDRHRRRNHPSSRAGKSASRVFASSAAVREAIAAQLAGCDPFED